MLRRRVRPNMPLRQPFKSGIPNLTLSAQEAPTPRHVLGIDELAASPWIGLHYRHEFLLHHRHESLEPLKNDSQTKNS
jgi:hypothetical protein